MGKASRGVSTLLTNAKEGKSSQTTSKEVRFESNMLSIFLPKGGGFAKHVATNMDYGGGWSKSTRPMGIRTKARGIHKNGISKVLINIMLTFHTLS